MSYRNLSTTPGTPRSTMPRSESLSKGQASTCAMARTHQLSLNKSVRGKESENRPTSCRTQAGRPSSVASYRGRPKSVKADPDSEIWAAHEGKGVALE